MSPFRPRLRRAARRRAPWVEPLARFGYAAKGVVTLVVGLLALRAALQGRETDASAKGALFRIFGQSVTLAAVIAVGLASYGLWRMVQAILDPERKGTSIIGLSRRIGSLVIGFVYGGLAYGVVRMVEGQGAGASGDAKAVGWTARLMQQPSGPWLVLLVGLAVLVYGIAAAYRGYKADFQRRLVLVRMGAPVRNLARRSGQVGEIARGIVWALIGFLLIGAGWRGDPARAGGIGGALNTLLREPFGPWLLGAVALGLVACGLFMIVLARHRRIRID